MTDSLRIAELWRYPVKSLGGEPLARAMMTTRGLAGDRRWLVTTPQGRFVTRRELPAMARITASHAEGAVTLRDGTGADLHFAEPDADAAPETVIVWRDPVAALPATADADDWLSTRLGRPLRLFHMPETSVRAVDPAYGAPGDTVSFADGFPLLVTTVESLAALNAQLADPVPMARFRPNLVLEGANAAFAEDHWHTLRIGSLTLRLVKPCTRCVITTQDPATGESAGNEPLRTLRAMGRLWDRQSIFGQNAIPDGKSALAVGDRVEVE